jgi:hypothetical protein
LGVNGGNAQCKIQNANTARMRKNAAHVAATFTPPRRKTSCLHFAF